MKLTMKQEKFAQLVITEKSQSAAYRQAYSAENMKPASVHNAATELMNNPKVYSRVIELKAASAIKFAITRDSLLQELEDSRQLAIEERQSSAATAAIMGKAKLLNLDKVLVVGDEDKLVTLIQRVIVG